ncbi:hypothetical protein PIB30_111648, partial [Stylosanthes scabra]|nr:hypothetical protein [Stylosanthes scabra]
KLKEWYLLVLSTFVPFIIWEEAWEHKKMKNNNKNLHHLKSKLLKNKPVHPNHLPTNHP